MMLLSFPIGAYVVFETDIGKDINYEFPINYLDSSLGGVLSSVTQFEIEIGDMFIVLWSLYAIFFSVATLGPRSNFLQNLIPIMTEGKITRINNSMVAITKWFSILVLVSIIINFIQEGVGITITPPAVENNLVQFYAVTLSPMLEEIGFRIILTGIPLFLMYSYRKSITHFFKSLWSPHDNLDIHDNNRRALILILSIGILFGLAHILSVDSWSNGKFVQAAASGMILGWVYFRYGFVCSLLIHWATNYFIFSFAYFISEVNEVSLENAFSHSLLTTTEILFVASGVISSMIILVHFIKSKKEHDLKV